MKYVTNYWVAGSTYMAIIPKKPAGTVISYVIEVTDSSEDNVTTTSLRYYYFVAKDGAPRIVNRNEDFTPYIIFDDGETIELKYTIYDSDDVYNEHINLYYSINAGITYTADKSITGTDEIYNLVNVTFSIPSPFALGLVENDILSFWVEAIDEHDQVGETAVIDMKSIGLKPYITNVYLSPSVPTTEDSIIINADIVYKYGTVIIDEINSDVTYTINGITNVINIGYAGDDIPEQGKIIERRFNTTVIDPLATRGTLEVIINIKYDTVHTESATYYFSVIDNIPSAIENNHFVFTNTDTNIKNDGISLLV